MRATIMSTILKTSALTDKRQIRSCLAFLAQAQASPDSPLLFALEKFIAIL